MTTTAAQPGYIPEGFDIPPGQYKARGVAGSDQYGTSDTGNDQVAVDLVLLELGRTVTTILHFTTAAEPYSLDRLRLMGWKGGDSFDGIDASEVPVLVKYEQYTPPNGGEAKWQMRADIISSRFSFKAPMGDAQKRDLFARLNKLAAQQEGKTAAPPAAAGGAPPAAGAYPPNWDEKGGDRPALKL